MTAALFEYFVSLRDFFNIVKILIFHSPYKIHERLTKGERDRVSLIE